MDDFNVTTLSESRNEYCALLISRLTPQVIEGIHSIFNDAVTLCKENDEDEKYLMTFQNFLGRVPKWNQEIVETETERIMNSSNCVYLEDLLTCVHITQLKILTNMRAGNQQKKIEIDIPKLSAFIHKVYIETSRRVYKNVFLYEQNILPLQKQKNMRELEIIVKECILNTIRDNMPLESILKSYLDESTEENVEEIKEEIKEVVEEVKDDTVNVNEPIHENLIGDSSDIPKSKDDDTKKQSLIDFSNTDNIINYDKTMEPGNIDTNKSESIDAPKSIERLEKISDERWEQRRLEEYDEDDDDDEEKLTILSDVKSDSLGIQKLETPLSLKTENLLGDVVKLD